VARIAGVDLPRNKRMEVALTYIHGIGRASAQKILAQVGIDPGVKTDKLPEADLIKIRDLINKEYKVEGDLKKEVTTNIKRLIDIGAYRGSRHRKNLPVRGQRTHTNSRTRKGPRKSVAIKIKKPVSKIGGH
jgi:small subunit ribosomal protein S13